MSLQQTFRTTVFLALLIAAGCASTAVDLDEPRRLLGTENDVRLDAQIRTDTLTRTQQLPFNYAITNNRPTPIAVAELIPEATYDADTQVVTLTIGTEVPGEDLLPRLALILPGQKREFAGQARVIVPVPGGGSPNLPRPNGIQIKLNFLAETQDFKELIGIPERAVRNPQLADALFAKWVEGNETLYTNVLPMKWSAAAPVLEDTPRAGRGRRGRP